MSFFQKNSLGRVCVALLWAALLVGFVACDSGDIEEQDPEIAASGVTAQFDGRIDGGASWPSNYQLVIAAFEPSSDYSLSQKQITAEQANGDTLNITLPNINSAATSIELCVVNSIRKRIATFKKFPIKSDENRKDTLHFEIGHVDASMFQAVSHDVFEEHCAKCHGEGEKPAAGMDLRPVHLLSNTVNVTSSLKGNELRIIPGNADESWVVKVLSEGNGHLTHFNGHPEIFNNERDRKLFPLLKDWINHGAKR